MNTRQGQVRGKSDKEKTRRGGSHGRWGQGKGMVRER